jgi:hypothetical protein
MRLAIVGAISVTMAVGQIGQPYPQGGQYPGGQYPQGGGYPQGGQYPGGGYPGGGGLPIPKINFPKRKSKEEKQAENEKKVKVAGVEGRLRKLDRKDLLLEIKGTEVLRFRLVAKTQFRKKNGDIMRDSLLNPGDRISVQVDPEDEETALIVSFLEAGSQEERAAADKPINEASVRAPRAGDLGKAKTVTLGGGGGAGEDAPAESSSSAASPDQPVSVATAENRPVDAADNVILDAAREAALKFTSTLPDFVAQQSTERSFTPPSGGSWQPIDVVTAEVTYSRGRESYRNVQIDGRPTTRSIESTGNWSTGEFGMVLEGLMAEDSKAQFRRRPGSQRAGNRGAWVFDFSVAAANSHWVLVSPDKREYTTAFTGSVWIDQETRRVIRIERKTVGLPQDYPLSKSESIINYGYATIDKTSYLLPAGGENVNCANGGSCSRNVLTFTNYRKFGADSNIKFFRSGLN